MADRTENSQDDPASDEREEVGGEDEEQEKRPPEGKPGIAPAEPGLHTRPSMINQTVSKKNRQLHRLYLFNKTEQCLLLIEVCFRKQYFYKLVDDFSKCCKMNRKRYVNSLLFPRLGLPKIGEMQKQLLMPSQLH